jgi:hypothetical protein
LGGAGIDGEEFGAVARLGAAGTVDDGGGAFDEFLQESFVGECP